MRYDIHLRAGIRQQLAQLAARMREWESGSRLDGEETERVRQSIGPLDHTLTRQELRIVGADGSGEFPALTYGDSFVYVTLAQATLYRAETTCGLKEVGPTPAPVLEFIWLPEDESRRTESLDAAFESLAGMAIPFVIEASDYRLLKGQESRRANTVTALRDALIRPHASDAGNLAVQLRSTAELGAALRAIAGTAVPTYVLIDGTLSLPFVSRVQSSLFHEHLKRLCCVEARNRGVGFFALSKSHGLPGIESIEEIARETLGLDPGKVAEHWYLRIPIRDQDAWELSLTEGRRLPPVGAVSYLVRFHRTTPVLRLDMDVEYRRARVKGSSDEETKANERRIFEDLDYASHDQRCYGYPYPIKAGHDRASLTKAERLALRKQIIDAAVRAGMKRSLFQNASLATGHE